MTSHLVARLARVCEFAEERCLEEAQQLTDIGANHMVACRRWQDIPPYQERIAKSSGVLGLTIKKNEHARQTPLLIAKALRGAYGHERHGLLSASPKIIIDDISFDIRQAETFALVGESGSGKTTVARALSGLLPYVLGSVEFDGRYDLKIPLGKRSLDLLRSMQLVFQNPDASLNPRQRVSQIVGRPLQRFLGLSGKELRNRVERLLEDVRLDVGYYRRFPDELSGGERQRVAIARALGPEPKLLLCDEILSGLDVSVQAGVLDLLQELQSELGISFLLISHDLAVVRSLAHRVGVMYWGSLCEIGDVEEVFKGPSHPYTYLLLSAVPEVDPNQVLPPARKDIGLLTEEVRAVCAFGPRCPWKVRSMCRSPPAVAGRQRYASSPLPHSA